MVRILVVDDDLAVREMMHMMLEYMGYDVADTSDGIEALEILRSSSDHFIVLLDLMMHTMSGLDVLRTVAPDPYLSSHHRYIFITASRGIEELASEQTVRDLAVPLIAKPFEMNYLLGIVDQVVRDTVKRASPASLASV
jgi:CheY-like chemotaxis protein